MKKYDTIRHTCGNHVCWTRMLNNGDIMLYTRDRELKSNIVTQKLSKWVNLLTDPFDDETIPVCDGNELMIVILTYGHATLAFDDSLECFKIIQSKRELKYKY